MNALIPSKNYTEFQCYLDLPIKNEWWSARFITMSV